MRNFLIYLDRKIFSLMFKVKTSIVVARIEKANWEVKVMTDEEIKMGKKLKNKLANIYRVHPEYQKFKKGLDRYEVFLEKMSEKYNVNIRKIRQEIQNTRGNYD